MVKQPFAALQPKPLPQGTPEFEQKRADLLRTFYDKIPAEYILPQDVFENPPLNVSSIPRTCGILTANELAITEHYDAVSLAGAIANKQLTAVEVIIAFCKRAIIAHQLTCCLTQWFMDEAIECAQQLDNYLATHGKTVGPFHGVPISVKDHIPLAGTFSSKGCFHSIAKDEKDCHMIQILRDAGAVFYVKTNQPQSLMHLESDSHWGRVLNPFNINLSAGGSTGGEAALIAMKGSVLGIGTDIGGSIRGPSAFCGIYGFKPTTYTLPQRDFLAGGFPGELNVLVSAGPMCRTMRDMDFFTRHILSTNPHLKDPRLIPLPWTGLSTKPARKLKIGIMTTDNFITPQPPVLHALKWATSLLNAPQHAHLLTTKSFHPHNPEAAWRLIRKFYWPDAANCITTPLAATGEPIHPLTSWITADAPDHELTATEVLAQRVARDDFRCAFAESWAEQDVDVVLCPAFVGPACKHDTALYWGYTSLWNLVDYPGVVVPTPVKVGEGVEGYEEGHVPRSEECAHVKRMWEEGGFEGAPVGLQLVGRRYADSELFGALGVLKEVLGLP